VGKSENIAGHANVPYRAKYKSNPNHSSRFPQPRFEAGAIKARGKVNCREAEESGPPKRYFLRKVTSPAGCRRSREEADFKPDRGQEITGISFC